MHKQAHTLTYNQNVHMYTHARHQRDMNSDFRCTEINLCRRKSGFGRRRQCISELMLQHGSERREHTSRHCFNLKWLSVCLEVDKTSLQHTREFGDGRTAGVFCLSPLPSQMYIIMQMYVLCSFNQSDIKHTHNAARDNGM